MEISGTVLTTTSIFQTLVTVLGIAWVGGKIQGKSHVSSDTLRDDIIVLKTKIERLEKSEHDIEVVLAKNQTTLFGQQGNNGLNSVVKGLESRVNDIDHKLDRLLDKLEDCPMVDTCRLRHDNTH